MRLSPKSYYTVHLIYILDLGFTENKKNLPSISGFSLFDYDVKNHYLISGSHDNIIQPMDVKN